ncbi:MAG: M20/M25/M40 family metallo-hydrolase, partial [Bacteroidales bacterium]
VMATVPSNMKKEVPAIGFIAHVDTAPDASGKDIKPQIVKDYDGKDIVLNKEKDIILKVGDFPEMADYKGQTIITTDGTTLLGADDKAGVAEIMSAAEYLMEHPEVPHGPVKIGFTPDEEIGRGVVKFDVSKFDAKYAYTIDGGAVGELEETNISYIIRDHDMAKFKAKKKMMQDVVDFLNRKYGEGTVTAVIKDQYYNMRKKVEPHYHIVTTAVKAMEMAGVKPKIQPIRGGTDGANLSFKGLPCPNIFAGGHNFHGKLEYVPIPSMEKAEKVILDIIRIFAER